MVCHFYKGCRLYDFLNFLRIRSHFYRGDNFCEVMFAFLYCEPFLKRNLLRKKRFAPMGSKFIPFREDYFSKWCKLIITQTLSMKCPILFSGGKKEKYHQFVVKSISCVTIFFFILLVFSGTFVCGLTVLCGARIRFKDSTKQKLILTNTSVAFLQLVTAFLFLLGWIWSIVWGVAFITISSM